MGYDALAEDEKTVIFAREAPPESRQSEYQKSLAQTSRNVRDRELQRVRATAPAKGVPVTDQPCPLQVDCKITQ
jgi:hypothetical protein